MLKGMICEEQVRRQHDHVVQEYKPVMAIDPPELEQHQEAQQGCDSTPLCVACDAGWETFPSRI